MDDIYTLPPNLDIDTDSSNFSDTNDQAETTSYKMATRKQQAFPEIDPFRTFGAWVPDHVNKLEIVLPSEDEMAETTNELTRSNYLEARYRRAAIEFRSGKHSSTTIRFNSVRIPYVAGRCFIQFGTNKVIDHQNVGLA